MVRNIIHIYTWIYPGICFPCGVYWAGTQYFPVVRLCFNGETFTIIFPTRLIVIAVETRILNDSRTRLSRYSLPQVILLGVTPRQCRNVSRAREDWELFVHCSDRTETSIILLHQPICTYYVYLMYVYMSCTYICICIYVCIYVCTYMAWVHRVRMRLGWVSNECVQLLHVGSFDVRNKLYVV